MNINYISETDQIIFTTSTLSTNEYRLPLTIPRYLIYIIIRIYYSFLDYCKTWFIYDLYYRSL